MTVKRKLQQANSASSELETVKAKLAEAVSAFSVTGLKRASAHHVAMAP